MTAGLGSALKEVDRLTELADRRGQQQLNAKRRT